MSLAALLKGLAQLLKLHIPEYGIAAQRSRYFFSSSTDKAYGKLTLHMLSRVFLRGVVAVAIVVGALAPAGSGPVRAIGPVTHNVATCADLQTLGFDAGTADDTINLSADLDCDGIDFSPLYPGTFTGTFDGRGHSVENLDVNRPGNYLVGFFSSTNGAAIRNLVLESGTVIGSNATGALVGKATATTVTNVVSHVDIQSPGSNVGGLIGQIDNPDTTLIQDVSVTGDVTVASGGWYVGGVIGYLAVTDNDSVVLRRVSHTGAVAVTGGTRTGGFIGGAHVTGTAAAASLVIEDSYNSGAVTTSNNETGGIIGAAIARGDDTSIISLTRVYSSGAVTGTAGVGGLFGIANSIHSPDLITITDSFATGLITGTADLGGLVGANSADLPAVLVTTNAYFDGPGTGQADCAGLLATSGDCTLVDTGAQPNYFKANHISAPLDEWDFAGTWLVVAGNYPVLIPDDADGMDRATEQAAPNAGDANDDGILDASQSNVASFPDPISGHYAVLQTSCGILFNVQIGGEAGGGSADVAYDYPAGLVDFVVVGCAPGATATITQYYYGSFNPATFIMRKWASANAYTTVPGATFTTTAIGGQAALKAVYQVTDGSSLDDDGAIDGNISDPAGPAVLALGVPNTGLGALIRS